MLRRVVAVVALGILISGTLLLGVLALARVSPPSALVFSRFEGERGRFLVYVDAASGAALARRTPLQASDVAVLRFDPEPRSPDGTQTVLPRVTGDGVDLFIADSAGALTQLTNLSAFPPGPRDDWHMRSNTYPLWSPDGQWISFLSAGTDGRLDLYRVRPDGSDLRMLYADVTTPTPLNLRWITLPDQPFPAGLFLASLLAAAGLGAWMRRPKAHSAA